jgi:hypothetical protein
VGAGLGFDGVTDKPAEQGSLRSLQSLLVRCLGNLILYAYSRGYELTLGEGYIQSPRKTRDGNFVVDGVHMPSSLHYVKLAIDLNLFVRGEYVSDGSHWAWMDLGNFWERLDPACSWGGRFHDANHLSVTFGGRK